SFGDYFKAEAIQWAWELLTVVWGIDPGRLYATYFEGSKSEGLEPDREAYDLWQRFLPKSRILPGNMKDNFWEMGDTGPCGPCSEIHYDGRTDPERARSPGHLHVNQSNPDVIEIWNLVFIQFNRTGPGAGGLKALPARHVDTGMGFERVTRVLQGKSSNYDTDVFTPLFGAIKRVCRAPDYTGSLLSPADTAYRVIADHARTLTIAITDGAEPGNEGRGYVLRRILRRAVRYGRQTLGVPGVFLAELVPTVVESLGGAFPELKQNPQRVFDIIKDEEEAFGRTLTNGLALFEKAAVGATAGAAAAPCITADDAFRLHDTYGFPVDLTQLMAEERGMKVDVDGFHRLMEEAREQSRAGARGEGEAGAGGRLALGTDQVAKLRSLMVRPTDDSEKFSAKKIRARVLAIWNGENFDEHVLASHTRPTDRFAVVLDKTSFYAEMGGQAADHGRINVFREARSSVRDAAHLGEIHVEDVRAFGGFVAHIGRVVKGEVRVGDEVELRVDQNRRRQIASNHTATHLLNHALRETLGGHVDQKGSLVAPDRLRFDFSHTGPVTDDEARRIDALVQQAISADRTVYAEVVPLAEGKKVAGLRAVFGETYPDPVRLVSIGAPVADLLADPKSDRWLAVSAEFCGGTHLASTAEAGGFAILSEEGVSKGVRRLTAVTGEGAAHALKAAEALASRLTGASELDDRYLPAEAAALAAEIDHAGLPLAQRAGLRRRLAPLQERVKQIHKQEAGAERERAVSVARELAEQDEGMVIVYEIPAGSDRTALMSALDAVRARHPQSAILLVSADAPEKKVTIVASVPQPLIERGLKAGDWVREASAVVGGKGGGRPDAAQGGGTMPHMSHEAVIAAKRYGSARVNA
ncbi:MAG TPA: alanine--tRNA ligase, partial [Phycisphaerales bacterium]|nr:alanine--tRNA ligase [Phycisphaerales bacterium]